MTYALRVACCLPAHALPAPIARIIALTAPMTLGLSGTPFHEPFHEPFHARGAADSEGGPLIGVIIDRQGSDAGRWTLRGSPLTGANGQRVWVPTVTHCVWRST